MFPIRIMLFGIALILFGILLSLVNFIGFGVPLGIVGLSVALYGLFFERI